jgi:hypothetical protein
VAKNLKLKDITLQQRKLFRSLGKAVEDREIQAKIDKDVENADFTIKDYYFHVVRRQ